MAGALAEHLTLTLTLNPNPNPSPNSHPNPNPNSDPIPDPNPNPHPNQDGTHDGSVDLLVTGCEVSLWIGEQFASDMHNAFPQLKIVTLSANKLLSQLGQAYPEPNRTLTPSLILTLTLSLALTP